jgi:hypothetical protein
MKKILFTVGAALVLLGGCKKSELELFPYNQVETTQAFNTEADVQLAVNGMYAGIRGSATYYTGTWNIFADVLADNLVLNNSGRLSQKPLYEWRYTGESTYGLFGSGYSITRRANAIVENIGKLPKTAFTDNATGEALAIRAMTYFDMSRVYSKTYTNSTDADLTIPYVTVTDPSITPAKEPVKGFYDKVIADLVQAEGLISASNGVGRLNKAAVAGLLSRVYFYKGDNVNTIAAAGRALGTAPNLPNIATFPAIWTDATEAGVLFKVKITSVDNINTLGVNYFQTVAAGIKSEYTIDYSFFQLFAANDVRKTAYTRTSAFNNVLQNHVIKYLGRVGQPAGVVDGKVIRTAEVLLNRAEAEYFVNPAAALADLVLLKTNRYTGYVPEVLSGQALLNEIQLQRRLELAFEGDRFFDIKRRNAAIHRDAVHGENADGTGKPPVFPNMEVGDKRFLLPIPQGELNFNKNLTQNPGY